MDQRIARVAVTGAGVLSAAVGAVAIGMWHVGSITTESLSANSLHLSYHSALCFTAIGIALVAHQMGRRLPALVAALVIWHLSLSALIKSATGLSLDLTQLWFHHAYTMAPNTAASLSVLASAILILGSRKGSPFRSHIVSLCASLAGSLGIVSLFGYSIGLGTFAWGILNPMAASAAALIVLLAIGVLISHWQENKNSEREESRPWLSIPVTLSLVTVTLSIWQALEKRDAALMAGIGEFTDEPFYLVDVVLVAGLAFAFAFGFAVHLVQSARAELSARRRAESELDNFFTLSIDMLCVADLNGYFKRLNPAWTRALGFSEAELQAQPLINFVHPDDRQITTSAMESLAGGNQVVGLKTRYRTRMGKYRWIEWNSTLDPARNIIYAVAADITEKRLAAQARHEIEAKLRDSEEHLRTEQQLRRSEAEFRQVAESMPQLVWVARPDGYHEWYNSRWYEYTGTTPAQAVGEDWNIFFHPDDQEHSRAKWERCLTTGEVFDVEHRCRRNDGVYRWFIGRALPIRDESNRIVRWFGTCTDIEDQKRAEVHLNQQWHTFDTALSHTPEFVYILDLQGRFTYVNCSLLAFWRKSLEEALGKNYLELNYPPELAERLQRQIQQVIDTREPFRGHTSFTDVTGGTRHYEYIFVPVFAKDNHVEAVAGSTHDTTDSRNVEQQLVLERQRAEEANRSKSAFLATMSHEIRTPMNALLGMSDLLWESQLDSEQRHYVEVFRRAGSNLLQLINDILDLSKIEAGHLELERSPFDLEEVVARSVELIAPRAYAKGLCVLCRVAPNVETNLVGDAGRLQQVFVNLLGNAIKFTERGEVVLSVQPAASNQPGEIDVKVSDTGIGIPAEKLESIFEDFKQADSSTTRQYGGTGLGLGISRRLVAFMGGQITAESEVGVGSIFTFTAKFEQGALSNRTPPNEMEDLHGRQVLVIDNNETNRLILRETLTSWGLTCKECSSAEEAYQALLGAKAESLQFSLVLLDRSMWSIDGFEAIPLLRLANPDIPIVMLSSDDRKGDGLKRRQLSVSGHAVKPVRRAELLRLICQAIDSSWKASSDTPTLTSQGDVVVPHALRILIAEDSPDNRMLVQAYLKGTPHQLTFANDGKQAVNFFSEDAFDLILMDMQMPVMDGLTATSTIRRLEGEQRLSRIAIVALTANAMAEDAQASYDAGCDFHLSKPISKAKLLSTIVQFGRVEERGGSGSNLGISIPEELKELAPHYLAARINEIATLRELIDEAQFESIRIIAHNLKGSGTSYGFPVKRRTKRRETRQ